MTTMERVVRMGRVRCTWCRKPLGNGEPLTDETVTVSERWATNSVGFVRVPIAAHETPAPLHAACAAETKIAAAASIVRHWQEEIDEYVADGRPAPPKWVEALTAAETELRHLDPDHPRLAPPQT